MKTIFVSLPPKFGMSEQEIKSFIEKHEDIALKAGIKLQKYLELVAPCLPHETYECLPHETYEENYQKEKSNACLREYMSDNVLNLCSADYVAFAGDWKASRICQTLHSVAVACNIPIIHIDTEDTY